MPQSTKNYNKTSVYSILYKNHSVLDNSFYIEIFEKYKRDNQRHRKYSMKKVKKKKKEEVVAAAAVTTADNDIKDKNSKNELNNNLNSKS